mgnify:CR=1 FL=1
MCAHRRVTGRLLSFTLTAVATLLLLAGCGAVSYTHLRANETPEQLVCSLLLEKKKKMTKEDTHRQLKHAKKKHKYKRKLYNK